MSRYGDEQKLKQADEHLAAGRLKEAYSIYDALYARDPKNAMLVGRLGRVFMAASRFGDAEVAFEEQTRLSPTDAMAWEHLGNARRSLRKLEAAVEAYLKALELDPDRVDAAINAGVACAEAGRLPQAVIMFERACSLRPTDADAFLNLGEALRRSRRIKPAIGALQRAVELSPQSALAHANLAMALLDHGDLSAAEAEARRSVELDPSHAGFRANLGSILRDAAQPSEAIEHLCKAVELNPRDRNAGSLLLYSMHFDPYQSPEAIAAAHREWARVHTDPITAKASPPAPRAVSSGRKLRIGYVSAQFQHSVVTFFLEPVLENHDRSRFEIVCFSNSQQPDATTERLRGLVDGWVDIRSLNAPRAAERVREEGIDILVDLSGHIERNRLGTFAHRPAPVQVTYLGYPDTTGMSAMDWKLTDAWHDPPGATDRYYSEKLWRLDRCAWAYRPPGSPPEPVGAPWEAQGRFTFGSFNILSKLNESVIDTWAKILRESPDSMLCLLCSRDEPTQQRILGGFASRGVESSRLWLTGRLSRDEYLKLFHRVDLCLDPFPFAGHTTSCDSLYMGVPFVTLAGVTHVQRTGLSLLEAVGLPELVCRDVESYARLAIELSRSPRRVIDLRRELRQRMQASPLMDGAGLARAIEDAYRGMWEKLTSSRTS